MSLGEEPYFNREYQPIPISLLPVISLEQRLIVLPPAGLGCERHCFSGAERAAFFWSVYIRDFRGRLISDRYPIGIDAFVYFLSYSFMSHCIVDSSRDPHLSIIFPSLSGRGNTLTPPGVSPTSLGAPGRSPVCTSTGGWCPTCCGWRRGAGCL